VPGASWSLLYARCMDAPLSKTECILLDFTQTQAVCILRQPHSCTGQRSCELALTRSPPIFCSSLGLGLATLQLLLHVLQLRQARLVVQRVDLVALLLPLVRLILACITPAASAYQDCSEALHESDCLTR
jgi:hypothetical protein